MALSEHQATHSSQEKPFSCEDCQKELTTYREVRGEPSLKNVSSFVAISLALVDTVSHRRMTNVLQLNHHKRYECAERRYPCGECGALFLTKQGRWNHRGVVHPDGTVGVGQIKSIPCCKRSCVLQSKEEQLHLQKDCAADRSGDVTPPGGKRGERTNTEEHSGEANIKKFKQEEEVADEEGGKHAGF